MVLLGRLNREWLTLNWYRVLVHIGALAPLVWLVWHYVQGLFLVDPVREITTITGRTALILLLLSLACTPLSTLTGLKQVVRVRRALGLYASLYAGLHFLTFVGLDYGFDFEFLGPAIFGQRYVIVGFTAGSILLVLAVTSTKGWQRRLKRNWKRLHRLVYLAGPLVIVHFLWLSKDDRLPWRYGVVLALLLALRIPPVRRAISRLRHWLTRTAASLKGAHNAELTAKMVR
jgi:sulfoxide reductase heme-binding subunit YedZ